MQSDPAKSYMRRNTPAYRRVTIALAAAAFTTFALLYCVQPLLPVFSKTFDVAPAVSSLALSVSSAALAVGMLIMGPISDAFGRKNVMTVSLFSVSILSILSGFAPNWTTLVVIRGLLGFALAGVPAVGMAYLAEEVHPQDLGAAMGLYIGGNAIGGLAGRLLTGILIDLTDSAQVALVTVGSLGLLTSAVFALALPSSRHFIAERDVPIRQLGQAFARHLGDPGLLRLYSIGFLLMGGFVTTYNYASYRLLIPPFDLSQAMAGMVFIVYLVGGPASAWFGRLSGKLGRGPMLLTGIGFMLAGIFITSYDKLFSFVIGLAFMTMGFFGGHAVASGWVSHRATVARAQAASLYLFCYYVGASLIGSIGGAFWSRAGWLGIVGLVATLLCVAAIIAMSLRRMEQREHQAAARSAMDFEGG